MTLDVSRLFFILYARFTARFTGYFIVDVGAYTLADGIHEIHLDPLHMHREVKLFGAGLCATHWNAVSAEIYLIPSRLVTSSFCPFLCPFLPPNLPLGFQLRLRNPRLWSEAITCMTSIIRLVANITPL